MKLPKLIAGSLLLLLGNVGFPESSTIVQWNFNNISDLGKTQNIVASLKSEGIMVSDLVAGGNIGLNTLGIVDTTISSGAYTASTPESVVYDGQIFEVEYGALAKTSNASATVDSHYSLNFSINVESEYTMALSTLSFDFGYDANYGGEYYAPAIKVYTSTTGSTWTEASNWLTMEVPVLYKTYVAPGDGSGTLAKYFLQAGMTVDLTSFSDMYLGGDTIYFRLLIAEGHSRADASSIRRRAMIDNITLSGELTAIPEPSAYALGLGLLIFMYACFRRRRG